MSKKKSYMDKKNILSEGFISKFLKVAIPAALLYKAYKAMKKSKIKKLATDIEKSTEKIKDADKRIDAAKAKGEKALEAMAKFLSKETGTKITKQSARKAFKDYTGK